MRMNRFRIVNFYRFFILGFFSSVATQICDERSYTLVSEPRRSVEAVLDEAADLSLCDDWIDEGTWYRFSSNTGDRIVERAANNPVPMFRCGTRAPIYIRGLGSHPVTDFANTTATVCANYDHDTCHWSGRIRIHRCPAQGNSSYYFLYNLQAPRGCSLSYCVGEYRTCNRGYRWNGSSCVNSFPAMKGFPIFSGPHVNGSGWSKEIYFRCQVLYDRQPNDTNARFRVTFLFDGLPLENIGVNATDQPERLEPIILSPDSGLTAILDESHLRGRLGREISCQAESYWNNGSKANSSDHKTSVAKYYAAFESTAGSYDIRLTNGSTHIVTFRSTLPLTCSHSVNSTSCRYKFRMMRQSAATPQCSVDWTDNDTALVTVYFVPGVTQEGRSFALVFNPYNDDQTTARRSLWRDYVVPPVTMNVVPQSTQYLNCHSIGDPHLKTFDGVSFNNYMVGDFYLVRAKDSENFMEIQVRQEICFGGATCNCGIVVREGNSAFKISVCEAGPWGYVQRSPTVVRLLSQQPADSSTVYTDGTGLLFSVRMPSGLRVEVDLKAPSSYMYVYLPPEYHKKTDSLSMCGNSNGNKSDDFITNLEQFRIPESLSYFRQQPGCSSIFNPSASWCGCNRTNNSPVCSNSDPTLPMISASNTPYPIRWTTGVVCHNITNQRKRRDATPHDDSENDFILDNDILFPPYKYDPNFGANVSFSWPTPKRKTEQEVERYSMDTLRSSPAYADCKANANLSTIVDMCKSDVQIADDWISVSAYASAFEQNCLNNIAASINSSSNSSSSNSTLEVLTLVSGKICPNNCSDHGNCSEGNCTCTTGYIGADCSINQSRPPSLTGIIRGGVCDVSKRPCDVISVFGSGVVSSSAIKCRFTDIKTGAYAETDGTFITAVEYSCPVPETTTHRRRRSVTARTTAMSVKNVSISTDGVLYSNSLGFVLFDSVCMECSNSDTCRQKNDSCLHVFGGECSADGAFNPDDSCLQCVPSVSKNSWTNTAVAGNWSSCTRNCDVGVAARNTVCGYGFTKKEIQFCKVQDCPDNKEEERQGVGITLASNDLQKILLDPAKSLASITDALNQFCSKNAATCCKSIGMKTRIFDVTYTSPDLVTYATGYPVISTADSSLKIIVKIDREKLKAGCSRSQTKGSNIVYADPKLIYDVVNSKKNDIEQVLSIKITSVWSSTASSSATSHTCTTFSIVYSLVGFWLFVTALEWNNIA